MHGRPRLSRFAAAAVAAGLCSLAACGSSSSTVAAKTADFAGNPLCAKVAQHWPATAANQTTRSTNAGSDTVRAWGDPAIIARCGVSPPSPSTDCMTADGVDWVMTTLSDGASFVTYGRTPAIQVLVPKKYGGDVLAAFSDAARQVPQGTHRCS